MSWVSIKSNKVDRASNKEKYLPNCKHQKYIIKFNRFELFELASCSGKKNLVYPRIWLNNNENQFSS